MAESGTLVALEGLLSGRNIRYDVGAVNCVISESWLVWGGNGLE